MKRVHAILSLWLLSAAALAGKVRTSKHDLSVSGSGAIKGMSEQEVCVYCHTPHADVKAPALWNRNSSGVVYTPYSSTTMKAAVGQPTGASKLCLSCHDGTVAVGMVRSRKTPIRVVGGSGGAVTGAARLGTDLSDDHPISFTYDSALAAANGELRDPAMLTRAVRLDADGQLQCTACHNPHDDQYGKFLVMNNEAAALCTACHSKNYWNASTHRTSLRMWNKVPPDPWPHAGGETVMANSCENCHRPHTAGGRQRLLNAAHEEQNCYPCHNGNVAAKNVQVEFDKASIHPIERTTGIHDEAEDPLNSSRHVECVDCHNPHAVNATAASVPNASGALAGLKGISTSGTVVTRLTREYELCFRCHADSLNRGPAKVTRHSVQTNVRLQFQTSNASYHPVVTAGRSQDVPSLIKPRTTGSLIYCTDCHSNNQGPGAGGPGPKGPHGSAYSPILERRQELTDHQAENGSVYALCYKCHSRSSILADESFPSHSKHVVDEKTACTTCHDSHGVAGSAHLINFNTTYVNKSTDTNEGPTFTDNGNRHGSCMLKCHGKDHNPISY